MVNLRSYIRFCFVAFVLCLSLVGQKPTDQVAGHTAIAQQVLIKFRAPTSAVLQAFQQLLDADEIRQLGGSTGPYLIHSKSAKLATLLAAVSGNSQILYVQPDYVRKASAAPNDPSFPQLWGLHNTSVPNADIGAEPAWDISTGSAANVVGVIDTGIDYNHPDLAANAWSAPNAFTVNLSFGQVTCPAGSHGYSFITRTCNPLDDNGHGTHVSGTIGAVGNNATGVTGVNWQTKIIGLKFLDSQGSGSDSDAIDAIEFAIQVKNIFASTGTPVNVRVLSNSYGGGGFSQAFMDEINKANTNGLLFVAAAGNAGANNDTTPTYPAGFATPNMVAVAATDINDTLAGFSNYGKNTVHLGAPGVSILSTLPNNSYGFLSGTSMSTPHVAGAAMLVLSACNLTPAALKTTLLSNVDPLPSLAATTVSGGRLNVNKAIRSCGTGTNGATSIWSSSATPAIPWVGDPGPVTLGVKFRSDAAGTITGIRFYKGAGNNGTHVGLLYSSTGALLGQAAFSGETASGWQQMSFPAAVPITANTTYVAAFFTTSGYADSPGYFTANGVDNPPLHALQSGVDGVNGVYVYGSSPQFPMSTFGDANYWVDVVFSANGSSPPQVPVPNVAGLTQAAAASAITSAGLVVGTVTTAPSNTVPAGSVISQSPVAGTPVTAGSAVSLVISTGAAQITVPNVVGLTQAAAASAITSAGLVLGTVTTAASTSVPAGSVISENPLAGTPVTVGSAVSLVVSTGTATTSSIWNSSAMPAIPWIGDPGPVTLGVKFRSDAAGTITGIRFYKGAGNNGTHIGLLYSSTGALLGQTAFSGETASGWQQVSFPAAVAITANTTYVAAFFTTSGYADSPGYFTSNGVDNPPLHALQSGVDGVNGVYVYGGLPQFPSFTYGDANYWVDVVFSGSGSPAPQVSVPNVAGLTQSAATTSVTGAGLLVGTVTTAPSTTVPAGSVISESPVAGTLVNAGSAVSLVVSTGTTATSSIWSSSATPAIPWVGDPGPVTLGVKFRSDAAGRITGIRFYKGADNNGTHIGLLYSSTGALLGQAAFSGEAASGWQQVSFPTAVPITANTTYVAAFFTTSGYADSPGYFTASGVDNPPLHALQSGADGVNGVYVYGGSPQFPSFTYGDANYWVDVVFSAN